MKTPFLIGLVIVLCGLFVGSPVSEASGTKHKTPSPTHQQTIVSTVTADAVTVTTQTLSDKGKVMDEKSRTFVITKFTEITVNGQKGTVADLKPGMTINVTIGTDPARAGRIDASGAPPEDQSKKKKKK